LAQLHLFVEKFADQPTTRQAELLRVEVLPKALDEEVARYMVAGFGGVLTRMTPAQADYLGVSVEGPFKPDSYRY
ncbi:MAG: adenosylhomocysteinase, partial [Halothiobacillus sp.]